MDLNQVALANIMMQIGNQKNAEVEENMIRHMILNSLRSYRMKFGDDYGELVIACDSGNYWRKQIFPYYKANRKKSQEASDLDWKEIFRCLGVVRSELKEFFPYRVIQIDRAEADDVIATVVEKFGSEMNIGEPLLILSGDKDFIQLHTYANVSQYDPTRKKWITHNNPDLYLMEHIMKGDSSDGIPNILSNDNCFVIGQRQKPLTAKRIEAFMKVNPSDMETSIARNWSRNAQLIDLKYIPSDIKEKILEEFENESGKDRKKMFDFFIARKLKHLMSSINEF